MNTEDILREIITDINAHNYTYSYENCDTFSKYDDRIREIGSANIIGQGRWETFKRQVYSVALNDETRDVKFFAVEWADGSTEYQDNDEDSAEAYEVVPEQRVITEYVKK